MQKLLALVLLLVAANLFSACASKEKSGSHVYQGDGPSIRFNPEDVGGPVSTR